MRVIRRVAESIEAEPGHEGEACAGWEGSFSCRVCVVLVQEGVGIGFK